MQTFLPESSFELSAIALRGQSKGWVNHPATKMWRGYEESLSNYLRAMILEWVARGYKNTMAIPQFIPDAPVPPWMGDHRVHASHRANLKRKDPIHYARYIEDPTAPYFWPITAA